MIWLSIAFAVAPTADQPGAVEFQSRMERMAGVISGLKDCTFSFQSTEYVGGAMTELATADVKFRMDEDIYMVFTGGPGEGRRLLYRGPDWNNGKFRIDPGKWIPTLNLHPDSRLATRGNRHTIHELPLNRLGEKVLKDALRVRDHATWKPDVTALGAETIGGNPARCFESRLPKSEDSTLYAHRVNICFDDRSGLPARIRIWDHEDGSIRLVESYEYHDLSVNVGLTDDDFEPATYGL